MRDVVTIYTDGACSKNPGTGGWAAVLVCGSDRWELSGGYRRSTSSRMEILAAIHALEGLSPGCAIDLYADSKYLVDAVSKDWLTRWSHNGWRRVDGKAVKNADLWQCLLPHFRLHSRVTFHWVKGHNGTPENERADQLASEASKLDGWPEDGGYTESAE